MNKKSSFSIYIGIDQTGAVNGKGEPRPLTLSLIDNRQKPRPFTDLKISNLDHAEIQNILQQCIPDFQNEKVLICIDTVFGLPETTRTSIEKIFHEIQNFHLHNKPYGALTAHAFFNQFRKSDHVPQRKVELLVGANSVFNLKPFQKNIGCGSYRIIKNLAADRSWYSLWPFEKPQKQFVIAEGYPSFFWKTYLKSKTRDLSLIQNMFANLEIKNLDQADSLILALGAMLSEQQIFNFEANKQTQFEGWILGVPQ